MRRTKNDIRIKWEFPHERSIRSFGGRDIAGWALEFIYSNLFFVLVVICQLQAGPAGPAGPAVAAGL